MKRIHSSGTIAYELERPVMKDTVIVPDGGYVVLRFFSDNPGFWALHCHLSFHLETGKLRLKQAIYRICCLGSGKYFFQIRIRLRPGLGSEMFLVL